MRAVEDIKLLNVSQVVSSDGVLELIRAYGKTWFSLDAFDKQWKSSVPQTVSEIHIEAQKLHTALAVLKQELIKK